MPDDITDPRAFRWVESGVSGLARAREWDSTAIVELPELETESVAEVELTVRPEGVVGAAGLPEAALLRLIGELEQSMRRPFAVRAVRQGSVEWLIAARELKSEVVALGGPGESLELALSPDGALSVRVDGEELIGPYEPSLARALAELERRGRERFQAFVARADKVDAERWEVTIDPL